jgi:hypothetical protein
MDPESALGALSVATSDLELTQLLRIVPLSAGAISLQADDKPKARGDRRVFRARSGPVPRVLRKLRVIN